MPNIYIIDTQTQIAFKPPYLLVFHNQEPYQQINIAQVSAIILWHCCHLSRETTSLALFRSIPVLFVGKQGESLGRFQRSSKHQPKCLKYQQQREFDTEFILTTAESIIRAKLHNCYIVLQRLTANRSTPNSETALDLLVLLSNDLSMAKSVQQLREYGVMAATFYYPALASLLPLEFGFKQRKKQPPMDGINCLLCVGYTLLHQTIETCLQNLGLHPDYGNLYATSYHQSPLACDLMAEFRAPLVDELVVELVMSKTLTPNDFMLDEKYGGMSLHPKVLEIFFHHWEEKLQTQIIHPYAGKTSYRCCLEWQVKEYIACLLGDSDSYRPMLLQ